MNVNTATATVQELRDEVHRLRRLLAQRGFSQDLRRLQTSLREAETNERLHTEAA